MAAMASDPSFDDVMAQLRSGRNDAATQVFNRFAGRLLALARKQLDPLVLQKVDPEDVVQSVFRSFFARNEAGQFGDFASWDNLWGMLVLLTQRKCGRRRDYFHAACRDVGREVPAELPTPDESTSDVGVRDDEPTPSEAALLTDTVERLLSCLEGRHREILTLSLQGYVPAEISVRLGCTERTVYRVLERVKQWLEAMRSEPDEGR
jgi:RNA polymerase sigma-70 factor (ECF subfamily)